MSGRYSLNTFGNIIKYDHIRSNIGIGNLPDIYAKLKVNSVGSGETSDLWISSLFGGNNDKLNKIAIGTINSNSCIGAVDTRYNFTDLYINSDTSLKNIGNVYILGFLINSNNVYMYSNLNVNGNIGIGKNPAPSVRLDINGLGNGNTYNNWISASIGCVNNNLNRIAIGVINSNAIIGSVDSYNSNIWKPLILNGDGKGNGCNVIIDTDLNVTSNLSVLNGNIMVSSGNSNIIFIGNNKSFPSIYCYNNYSSNYDILYLNSDKNNGGDVVIRKNLFVNTNVNIEGSLNINKIITNEVNSWINATLCSSNIYDDRTIIGTLNSNSVIGSVANDYSSWKPLYLNGDILSGKGSDVYIINSLNVFSNINILNQNFGIGIGTSYSSNKLHVYNTILNDVGIIIENKNILPRCSTSMKMFNDTSNSFNIYLNSSRGGNVYLNDTSSNAAVIVNTCGNLLLQTKNNKGITISEDSSILLNANLFANSNVGIKTAPVSSNTLSVYGNIGLYDTLSTYNYNIYTDKLYSNLTWILPNRYPNKRELFTYNTISGKLDWINIADFDIDYWNVGHSNYTGYLTISQQNSNNVLFPNNFKIGFKSSNISIGNYIYRRYPKNIYTDTNISYDFTDINYNSFTQNDIILANNNRIFIKYDTASYGFNLIRTGVIIKKYQLYSSNIVNNNLNDIANYFNLTKTPYTYDIINSTNAINFSSSINYVTEISFLFIPTISTNYVFTIKSQHYYGTLHIDTINSLNGSYSTINAKYPYFFDYSYNTGTTNILLPSGEIFGNSITSFTANNIYRIIIRLVHLSNDKNLQLWYTNNTNSPELNNIFNDTTNSIYYKLTNSRYAINFPSIDYTANSTYNIDALLINDIADSFYYSKKYLTNYSNLLNPNNNIYWATDKIFTSNGNIDTSVVYYGMKDVTLGTFNMSGFSKDGNTYSLASYVYNPISQNILTSFGTTIIYKLPTNIKLLTYGILTSSDINSAPSKWQLYGSLTGLTNTSTNNYWELLDDRVSYNDYKPNNASYFIPNTINIKNYYKYFALVVSAITGNSKQLSISSLIFNGIDSTYSVDSLGNVSDPSYFNDILSLNYQGDIGVGISNPKYKLDVAGSVKSYNLHTSGYIISDNDITTYSSIYSSNLIVYGDINAKNGVIASTVWGELHGKAYLYTPYIYGNTNLDGNIYISSNVSIGKSTLSNYRLDVNSYGSGLNNSDWAAARFGGILSSNRVIIGTINNNACVGAINENTGAWGELLLNGDRNGRGSNVIVSTNLLVNSNLQISSNISIGRNILSNIRLDVASYGTGINNINWIAGRFGGSSGLNNIVVGSLNNIPCIGGNNDTNSWVPIILNGDGTGNGANVSIGTNLNIGCNISINSNIYIGENATIGNLSSNSKSLRIYGNITTFGNDINNGIITSSGGISVLGGNISLTSPGGLIINGGTGAAITGSENTLTSTTINTLSATIKNNMLGATNNIAGTNNFLSGITSNCITAPNTAVLGNLTIFTGPAAGNLDVKGLITGNTGLSVTGTTLLIGSTSIIGLLQIKTSGLIVDNNIICNGLSSSDGLSIVGGTNLSAGESTNLISSSTSTTITGPLIVSGSTTTNITNTTSFTLTSPTTSIESLVNIGTNSGVGAAEGGAVGTVVVGSATYASKSLIVYGNIEARGTADGNNGKIIAANGLTMSAGDFTIADGNLNVTNGSATIGNNVTIGDASSPDKNLTIFGNITINKYGLNDGRINIENGITVTSGTNSITCTPGGTNTLSAPSGTNIITGTNNNFTATTNTFTGSTNTAVVGPFSVSGLITANGGLTTPLNLTTTGSGSISSSGSLTINGTTTLSGATSINNNLTVTGTSLFNGNFSIAGNFATTSAGTITSSGAMISSGGLTVSSGNLNIVSGSTTLNGNVAITSTSTLTVSGLTTATGGVTTPANIVTTGSGSITSASTIVSSGAMTSGGALTVSSGGITVVSGTSTINGNVNIQSSGSLSVAGLTTATGGVTTPANIATTGTGTITSAGKLTASSSMDVNSGTLTTASGVTSTFNGNVNIANGSTLSVAGAATCASSLSVTGATNLGGVTTTGTIVANGPITANNGISMPGTVTAGAVTTTGTGAVTAGGPVTAGGAVTAGTTITSGGAATLGGNTTIKGGSLGCTLSVTGTIGATSDIGLVSDERLKTDITTIQNALEKVNKLRGVYYKRNKILDKDENIDRLHIGLIAQEVEKIVPESVIINEESKEKYRSVIYQNMVGLLIEAIKELDTNYTKKINDLTDRISVLENAKL